MAAAGTKEFGHLKAALSRQLRELREAHDWSQQAVAKRLHTTPSRVADMEAADPAISLDALVRALLALGADRDKLEQLLGRRSSSVIAATTYDEQTQTLQIEFKSGRVYRYFGVPKKIYEEFLNAPSQGEYFNTTIRNNYRYREVTAHDAKE